MRLAGEVTFLMTSSSFSIVCRASMKISSRWEISMRKSSSSRRKASPGGVSRSKDRRDRASRIPFVPRAARRSSVFTRLDYTMWRIVRQSSQSPSLEALNGPRPIQQQESFTVARSTGVIQPPYGLLVCAPNNCTLFSTHPARHSGRWAHRANSLVSPLTHYRAATAGATRFMLPNIRQLF